MEYFKNIDVFIESELGENHIFQPILDIVSNHLDKLKFSLVNSDEIERETNTKEKVNKIYNEILGCFLFLNDIEKEEKSVFIDFQEKYDIPLSVKSKTVINKWMKN